MRHDQGRSPATSIKSRRGRHWYRRVCAVVISALCSAAALGVPARGSELRRALVIGDSVTVGAMPTIEADSAAHGWSVTIDAEVGRTTAEGAAILAAMHGQLPPVVVVELGNNDGENPSAFGARVDDVMRELAGVQNVVWYSMSPFASWVPGANDVLRAAAARWPNLSIADWSTVAETSPGVLSGSGPHLLPDGARAFADLLYRMIDPIVDRPIAGRVAVVMSFRAPAREISRPFVRVEPVQHAPRAWLFGGTTIASGKRQPLVAADGGVFAYAGTRFYGALGTARAGLRIVHVRPTATGLGYWLYTAGGGIFAFGDARFCG
jgi:hypothetical protein